MGLTFVDLAELLFIVDFDADTVLKHVLDVRFALHRLSGCLIFNCDYLLEVRGMGPCDLDCSRGLCNVSEHSLGQAVLLDQGHVIFDDLFVMVDSLVSHKRSLFVDSKVIHRDPVSRQTR